MGRTNPGAGPSPGERILLALKAKRAAELAVDGWTLDEIGAELGYESRSGVSELLSRYTAELPREALEERRRILLARLDEVHRRSVDVARDETASRKDRDRAELRIIRAAHEAARISGLIKAPAPMVQVNVGGGEEDLSRLSLEELAQLRAIRLKLSSPAPVPALDVAGHEVDESDPP